MSENPNSLWYSGYSGVTITLPMNAVVMIEATATIAGPARRPVSSVVGRSRLMVGPVAGDAVEQQAAQHRPRRRRRCGPAGARPGIAASLHPRRTQHGPRRRERAAR